MSTFAWSGGSIDYAGMALRDYFAGQELAKVTGTAINDLPGAYDNLAKHCYKMADAMIRARQVAPKLPNISNLAQQYEQP